MAYKTVSGFCSTTNKPVGFQLKEEGGAYYVVGSFSITPGSKSTSMSDIRGKIFNGGFKCKYCQSDSFFQCDCGNLICAHITATKATCPSCHKEWQLRVISDDEVKETTVKGIKQ